MNYRETFTKYEARENILVFTYVGLSQKD